MTWAAGTIDHVAANNLGDLALPALTLVQTAHQMRSKARPPRVAGNTPQFRALVLHASGPAMTLSVKQLEPYDKTGWLVKEGGFVPSWKQRYFVLKGALLFYFEVADASAPKGCVFLKSNYKIIADARKDPHVFEIRPSEPGERVWVIAAPTREDKDEWIAALVAAMKLHTLAGNNHTKEMLKPFTKAAFMEKEGAKRKNWKRRFFVLKGPALFYFKPNDELLPIGCIILTADSYQLTLNCPKRINCFELKALKRGDRSWFFSCETPIEMQEWADAIALALNGQAPSLRSQLAVSVTQPLPPDLFGFDEIPAAAAAAVPSPSVDAGESK